MDWHVMPATRTIFSTFIRPMNRNTINGPLQFVEVWFLPCQPLFHFNEQVPCWWSVMSTSTGSVWRSLRFQWSPTCLRSSMLCVICWWLSLKISKKCVAGKVWFVFHACIIDICSLVDTTWIYKKLSTPFFSKNAHKLIPTLIWQKLQVYYNQRCVPPLVI